MSFTFKQSQCPRIFWAFPVGIPIGCRVQVSDYSDPAFPVRSNGRWSPGRAVGKANLRCCGSAPPSHRRSSGRPQWKMCVRPFFNGDDAIVLYRNNKVKLHTHIVFPVYIYMH